MPKNRKTQQQKWLKKTLKNSKGQRVILKSCHEHGSHGNCSLNELYKMIGDTKKVHLMLTGHDHDNQHLSFTNKPESIMKRFCNKKYRSIKTKMFKIL